VGTYWQSRAETEKALEEKRRPEKTLKACFMRGSNSTCRSHVAISRGHFEVYKTRCEAAVPPIIMNFRCIPQELKGKSKQTAINFPKAAKPGADFTRGAILDAVAKLIACDDQVSLRVRL
jgi:hypothetical protein